MDKIYTLVRTPAGLRKTLLNTFKTFHKINIKYALFRQHMTHLYKLKSDVQINLYDFDFDAKDKIDKSAVLCRFIPELQRITTKL